MTLMQMMKRPARHADMIEVSSQSGPSVSLDDVI